MSGVNKVILVGNLGADPEVRNLESGIKVATINIATTEYYKDKNGERQGHTEWHRVVLWRGLAGVAESYLKKGSQVYVEGRLRTRSYEDQEGKTRYVTEIEAHELNMLGRREDAGAIPAPTSQPAEYNENRVEDSKKDIPGKAENEQSDDLPF